MRRHSVLLAVCLATGLPVWAGTEYPAKPGEEVVANELIVHLMPGTAASTLIAKYLPGAQIQALADARFFRIRAPGGLANGISSQIAADSQVDFVEPNRVRHALVAAPNDPNYASSWWFPAVQALQAWSLLPGQYLTAATAGSGRVKVAVLDTGADCTHPDFINTGGSSTNSAQGGQLMFSASQAIVATTIVNPVCPWQDDHGHGTHVTGIVAAATSNAVGVSGLGYPVQVIEYKVLNSAGSGSDADIMNAIEAATNAGAQVVSMSLGGVGYSSTLQTAVNYAWQHNTLVVAAAGNDGKNELFFPASANHAVGVSATDSGNNLAFFSNFGNAVQLAAPGVGILSTAPSYSGTSQGWLNYVSLSGTSMATPFVAALAGLVAMTTPNATAQAILQRVEQTASSTTTGGGWGQNFGFGIINASGAISGSLRPAANGAITGQIVNTAGSPISGAQITVNNQTITTDLNSSTTTGLYRFGTLPAGTYSVTVSATGYATQSLSATVAPGADTSFTVTMGVTYGRFTGSVTDQGAGVAGAIVQALSAGLITGAAVADQNGQYTLWVPGGTYDVRASAIGRVTTTVSALTVGSGGTTSANLTLPRMGTIAGSVRDGNQNPVANAQVLVTGGTFSAAATTDVNGNFSLIGVPTGSPYSATATATGFLASTQNGLAVSADLTTSVSFTMASSSVATPTFLPPAGTYGSAQSVMIGTTTSGASIRYTTDGSVPTSTVGTLYNSLTPVAVSSSLTLKAIAYKTGLTDSAVATAAYTISGGGGPAWYNSSWTNRKAVTIDHTKVSGGASLANFAVLFSTTDANLKTVANGGSVGKSDGTDILFTAGDGTTKLDHELERYNAATGEVIAWVRIPSLSNTTDTALYIYYGNAGAANQQNPTGVWDSSYKGIWHLPNGTALNASDSTANANNGSIVGAGAGSGKIDGAGSFSGSSQYINLNNFAIIDPYNFTVEAWINPTDYANYDGIVGKTNSNLPAPFDLYLAQGTGRPTFYFGDGGSHYNNLTGTSAPGTGAWSHIVVVSSGSFANVTLTQYLNGATNGTTTFTSFTAADTNNNIRIASRSDLVTMFKGGIDEVRISSAPRSAGWIATEYTSQNSPGTFLAIGAQESSGGPQAVATPSFLPPAGTYGSAQSVMIGTTTSGASIRYTTDGSLPTSSVGTLYNSLTPVAVSSSLTLKAIAYKTGLTDSAVATAAYTISGGGGPAWYNSSWTNRKAVTIDHTKVSGGASLANFAVLFSTTDANLKTVANGGSVGTSDGTDILITAGDGTTKLDHELERYNASTGEVIAWVRIPSLSNTTDTALYIYYGNAGAANQQNPTGVWDSSYKGIWHLPNGAVLNASDSTANAHNGSIVGAGAGSGKIDGAGSFSGSSQYINLNNFAITDPYNFTVEAWINPTDYANYDGIVGKTNSNLPAPFDLYLAQGTGRPTFYFGDGGSYQAVLTGTSAPGTGAWSHIVVVSSGSFANVTLTQYLNGAPNGATAFTSFTAADTNNNIRIASRSDLVTMFKGGIDEVRISSAPRSAGWIATEYTNQNSPSTFVSVGAQESSGGPQAVATPSFLPPAGTYGSAQSVMIGTTTSGASIRYTTDGSVPTSTVGTLYNSLTPVAVSSSLTLKAIAYKTGLTDSAVATAAYTISGGGGPAWYNSSWTNRKAVTIDHTKVSGGASLANFAVLFSTTDANLKTVANGGSVGTSDGTDILFTAGDGTTKLDHELERYNAATGEVIAWVRIPSLSNTTDTALYIYYGNAGAANQQNPTGVWDSSYKGIWHLPNGAVLNASDSTANAHNGSIVGAGAGFGKIDGAGSFSGSSQYININNFAITDPYNFTVEAWINPTDYANYDGIVGKTNSNLPAPFDLYLAQGTGRPTFYFGDGGSYQAVLTGTSAPGTGAWSHIVVVSSGSFANVTLTQYLNGATNGTTAFTSFTAADTNNNIRIASRSDLVTMFKGGIDEVRISSAPRSAGWIATEFSNQNSPGTFLAIGAQESM